MDVTVALFHHLNHPQNQAILPDLVHEATQMGHPAVRLLKLLVVALCKDELYVGKDHIGRGAFAIVYRRELAVSTSPLEPRAVAEKVRVL